MIIISHHQQDSDLRNEDLSGPMHLRSLMVKRYLDEWGLPVFRLAERICSPNHDVMSLTYVGMCIQPR
jgi:hypothetical protein